METKTQEVKTYAKLGFSHAETSEIVSVMNQLLANYHVHYQKLRNFHWNVEGPEFFDLHEIFENQYNEVRENIDMIAERIRIFGKKPVSTLKKYLEMSNIEEVDNKIGPRQMVSEVLRDFEILLSFMKEIIDEANDIGDTATNDMITRFVRKMEKMHWMLTAWSKDVNPDA